MEKEVRPGEGDQKKKGTQIVRRAETPLVPPRDVGDKPSAVQLAELIEVEDIDPVEDTDLKVKKTTVRFRNITPRAEDKYGGETSEPSDSK